MGSGIAESMITASRQVFLYEPAPEPLDRARRHIAASLAKAAARGKLGEETPDELLERVTFTTRLEDLAGADAVIEAVIEDVDIKRDLFSRLDSALPDAQFLASNTSSIPIAELAAATTQPERVLGLHFFSPVPVMKLVEIVLALDTSNEVTAAAEELVHEIGKQPVHTKDRSGFIVNMLLVPYLMSAVRMFETGFASREDIDTGMKTRVRSPDGAAHVVRPDRPRRALRGLQLPV